MFDGAFVVGRSVGDFNTKTGMGAISGRPYAYVYGGVLTDTAYVGVRCFFDADSVPVSPRDGETVRVTVKKCRDMDGIPDIEAASIDIIAN